MDDYLILCLNFGHCPKQNVVTKNGSSITTCTYMEKCFCQINEKEVRKIQESQKRRNKHERKRDQVPYIF